MMIGGLNTHRIIEAGNFLTAQLYTRWYVVPAVHLYQSIPTLLDSKAAFTAQFAWICCWSRRWNISKYMFFSGSDSLMDYYIPRPIDIISEKFVCQDCDGNMRSLWREQ